MTETWRSDEVTVDSEPQQTIIVGRGVVKGAAPVAEDATARPRWIRPRSIGVRYQRYGTEPWTVEITLVGPVVRTDGSIGLRTGTATFPGGRRPPGWAVRYALEHHPEHQERCGTCGGFIGDVEKSDFEQRCERCGDYFEAAEAMTLCPDCEANP